MKKIIEEDGDNAWLASGTSRCHVRRYFYDTEIQPRLTYVDVYVTFYEIRFPF
jgi:hypothetical protein